MVPVPSKSQPGIPRPGLICAALGVIVFQFFGNAVRGYVDTASMFWWWISQWIDPMAESQHGWLILGISAWLFWRGVRKPDADDAPATKPAVAAMISALALHTLAYAVQQTRLSIVAFLLFAWGVLALIGGRRWARAARFPVAFMVFAIPLNVLDTLGFWLRLWVIEASTNLAHLVGVDVVRSGTQLFAPDGRYQYEVAAACSGVRSLMALAALSLLVGYLSFNSWWRRAVIFVLCFPLVYVGNVIRISAIVFAGEWLGHDTGVWVHEQAGFVVFVVVLGGLLAIVRGWQRRWPEPPVEGHLLNDIPAARARAPWAAVLTTVGAAAVTIAVISHLGTRPLRGEAGVRLTEDERDPVELPTFLGTEWAGRRAEVTAIERELLPPDTGFARKRYVSLSDPSRQVFLSIVLSGRDRTSIHRPELCLVGQGWTLHGTDEHRFRGFTPASATFPATLLRVRREVMTERGREVLPELVAYWFVSSDAVVATHGARVLRDAWTRLRYLRADRWAYVLMQTDARDGEAAALGRMQEVLDHALPAFWSMPRKPEKVSSVQPKKS